MPAPETRLSQNTVNSSNRRRIGLESWLHVSPEITTRLLQPRLVFPAAVNPTSRTSRFVFVLEDGQSAGRKRSGLPAGGVDTASDTAASCTLRPKSVRNRQNCASWRPAKLAAVDATAVTKQMAQLASVWITSVALASHNERPERPYARQRSLRRSRSPGLRPEKGSLCRDIANCGAPVHYFTPNCTWTMLFGESTLSQYR